MTASQRPVDESARRGGTSAPRRALVCIALAVVGALAIALPAGAAGTGPGAFDQAFNGTGVATNGVGGSVNAIALDPETPQNPAPSDPLENAIVLAGQTQSSSAAGVVSFTSSGAVNTAFTPVAPFSSSASASTADALAVVPSSGDIWVGGSETISGATTPAIAELSSSGATVVTGEAAPSLPSSVVTSGGIGAFTSLATYPSSSPYAGDVLAAGTVEDSSVLGTEIILARFLPSGAPDPSFNSDGYVLASFSQGAQQGDDTLGGLGIDASGDIYIDGTTQSSNPGCVEGFVGEFSAIGTAGPTQAIGPTGGNCNVYLNALIVSSTSGIPLLLGGAESAQGAGLSEETSVLIGLTAVGTVDSGFGSNGTSLGSGGVGPVDQINSLAYVPTSTSSTTPVSLVVSGLAYVTSGGSTASAVGVSRYSLGGALDTNFGPSGGGTSTVILCPTALNGCGAAVAVEPDSSIDVTGGVAAAGAESAYTVAQLIQREVSITSDPTVSVTGTTAPAADFTATFNSPALGSSSSGGTVAFTTEDGTALAGTDYTKESGTLTFPCTASTAVVLCASGGLSATIAIPVKSLANTIGTVTFSLVLSDPKSLGLGNATGIGTIKYATATLSPPSTETTTPVTTATPPPVTTTTTKTTTTVAPGKGYWIVTSSGTVEAFGDAPVLGGVSKAELKKSGAIVAIAATPDAKGYWLASTKGTVIAFGDAKNYGSVSAKSLHGVIRGFARSSTGKGYLLASSTGAVYAFGNARSHGSVASGRLSGTVVSFSTTSNTAGYWLTSSTGAVYAFGNARSYGSIPKAKLRGTSVSAMTPTSNSRGYLMATRSGAVYGFGNAKAHGSVAKHKLSGAIVGITPTPDDKGYWLVSSTGKIYPFGDAASFGSRTAAAVGVAVT